MEMADQTLQEFTGGSRESLILTLAVCLLLCKEPNRSMEEAVQDICQIHHYIMVYLAELGMN